MLLPACRWCLITAALRHMDMSAADLTASAPGKTVRSLVLWLYQHPFGKYTRDHRDCHKSSPVGSGCERSGDFPRGALRWVRPIQNQQWVLNIMDYKTRGISLAYRLLMGIVALICSAALQSQPAASGQSHEHWRKLMVQTPHAAAGCYSATYPQTAWQPVPCISAPSQPFLVPPSSGRLKENVAVGNGTDFSAQVSSGTVSQAEGMFPIVSNVSSETDGSANVYSLQLNTETFSTPACNGVSGCTGWQQFIYSTTTIGGAFMQYWLINYGATCPSGWNPANGSCYKNSSVVPVPAQPIGALRYLSLTGTATGSLDTVVLSSGTSIYSASGPDNVLSVSQGWTVAEFNIFGDGGSIPTAAFNTGATLLVRTSVSNSTTNAPVCNGSGFTFEGNNLSLVNPCCPYGGSAPGIVFKESNITVPTQSCSVLEHPLAWLPAVFQLQ